MLGDIRHTAAHRADALGLDLRRVDTQRLADNGKVRIEHDRAMMHHTALTEVLRVAGELLSVDRDVVAAVHLRLDAERRQRAHDRRTEELHIQRAAPAGIGDKGEIQVAHVVVDRAAAGETAHHADAALAHGFFVDLGNGILIFADNDRIVVLPEHEVHPVARQAVEHILLHRQIVTRVCRHQVQIR